MKYRNVFVLFLVLWLWVMAPLGASLAAGRNNTNVQKEGSSIQAASPSDAPKEDDEQEEAVSWQDVPDPVKATILIEILREVDELDVIKIEREKEDGKTVYEAEFQYKDREIELEMTPEGEFLEKEVKRSAEQGDKNRGD